MANFTFENDENLGAVIKAVQPFCTLSPSRQITNDTQLTTDICGAKFSKLCGFTFTSADGKDTKFLIVYCPKTRSNFARNDKSMSGWYCWYWIGRNDVQVMTKEAILQRFQFDVDKFFDSDLFEKYADIFVKQTTKALATSVQTYLKSASSESLTNLKFYLHCVKNSLDHIYDVQREIHLGNKEAKLAYNANDNYKLDMKNKKVRDYSKFGKDPDDVNEAEEILKLVEKVIKESNLNEAEFNESAVLGKLRKLNDVVKTPEDVESFVDEYKGKKEEAERNLDPKQRSILCKAWDSLCYASKKGAQFILNHWGKILILIFLIALAIYFRGAFVNSCRKFGLMLFGKGDAFIPHDGNIEQSIPNSVDQAKVDDITTAVQTDLDPAIASTGNGAYVDDPSVNGVAGIATGIAGNNGSADFNGPGKLFGHPYHGSEQTKNEIIDILRDEYDVTEPSKLNHFMMGGYDNFEPEDSFTLWENPEEALELLKKVVRENPR